MTIQEQITKIFTVCPICRSKKSLEIPDSIVKKNTQLTTISLPKGLVCDHHFQMYIDKNFKIRGYQKVDFEPKLYFIEEENGEIKCISPMIQDDKKLFDNLLIDGNYVEFQPLKPKSSLNKDLQLPNSTSKKNLVILKDIYEEFWEFIDDINPEFEDFILNDKRRIDFK